MAADGDTVIELRPLDRALVEHVLRWGPFGGPPDEHTFADFGISSATAQRRVHVLTVAYLGHNLNPSDRHLLNAAAECAAMLPDRPAMPLRPTAQQVQITAKQSDVVVAQSRTGRTEEAARLDDSTADEGFENDLHGWNWQLAAACRFGPSDLFYPLTGESRYDKRLRERRAKEICRRCPVIRECRTHGIEWPEPEGIWGALTPEERAAVH